MNESTFLVFVMVASFQVIVAIYLLKSVCIELILQYEKRTDVMRDRLRWEIANQTAKAKE